MIDSVPRGHQSKNRSWGFYPFTKQCQLKQTWERKLSKTLLEKDKMLVTSILSFPHNVFYPIKEQSHL